MKSIESPKINEAETFPMKIKSAPRSHHPNLKYVLMYLLAKSQS